MLHSKIRRRKKQRVAASADLASEVPNLGVARALFVILLLHVGAIAAIFIHNRVTDDEIVVSGSESQTEASAFPRQGVASVPAAKGGENFYFVSTGDTYERIARLKSVDVQELRELNRSKGLDPGAILRIPANKIESLVEMDPAAPDAPESPAEVVKPLTAVVKPRVTTPNGDDGDSATVNVREDQPAPVLAVRDGDPPRAIPVREEDPTIATYAVRRGDTVWRIAQRHDVSVEDLLKANGISDARKLQVNMKLRIPAR